MSYANGKLNSVTEGASAEYGYSYTGGGIGYDDNGNVNSMFGRGINNITNDWNHLSIEVTSDADIIQFVYNAAGQKLAQINTGSGENIQYYNRIVVKDGTVSSIEGSAGSLRWDVTEKWID